MQPGGLVELLMVIGSLYLLFYAMGKWPALWRRLRKLSLCR